jgi:uncharacterized protein YbcI
MDLKQLSDSLAARIASFREEDMGTRSGEVVVVVERDLCMIHIKEALSPSERILARSETGQALLQRFNNRLFNEGSEPSIKDEVASTLKRKVLDVQTSLSPLTGSLVVVFMLGQIAEPQA